MSVEILAPAGNMEKLKTAVYFGADAVYFSGKNFGLRAFAGNFSEEEIELAVQFCHEKNVKAYVTVNIVAHNKDFENLKEYLIFLKKAKVDAIIVSDLGIITFAKNCVPDLDIHVSTQANVTNKFSAKFLTDLGVKRIVLARELTLSEIREIRAFLPKEIELEAFVHGAMCISYSGRCLLSNYLANRPSNNGECIQACRWEYTINEVSRTNQKLPIEEDERGTYILNSKDLKMIEHMGELRDAGVTSFKIEGRMKSPYYVATVTNAYVRAKKVLESGGKYDCPKELSNELEKTSHRDYTTGFNFKDKMKEESENIISSQPVQSFEFMAIVLKNAENGRVFVEMRNKFAVGDTLEVLSPTDNFNKTILVTKIINSKGEDVQVANQVQEKLFLQTSLSLQAGDILRKEN
ncbi:MAG: U32 family peptidase [Clostridia bacterium]|nr:U32 family peptidase [Clostridia bacterium]